MVEAVRTTAILRRRIEAGPLLVVPGAANALAARIIEDLGFEAVYVTGAGLANTYLGVPDIGLVTLSELAANVAAIRDAVDIPIIVDADTGFGNAVNLTRTVRLLERAGADALQFEDQVEPKRCGHFEGKEIVSAEQMRQKLRAASDARSDADLVIIARTDARAIEGFDAAVDRLRTYVDAGADMTFLEAPVSVEEVMAIPRLIDVPQLINLVEGGRTPMIPLSELSGFRIALFANLSLQAAVRGMQVGLRALKETGSFPPPELFAPWAERQRLVRKDHFDGLSRRYAGGPEIGGGGVR